MVSAEMVIPPELMGTKQNMPKTASEMTSQEWQAYDPWAASRSVAEPERADMARRRRRAWRVARQAAELLRHQFGASKVVVFGSLAHRAWFTPRSDVDLAAWDIPADRFYQAVARILDLSADFRIDLVDPSDCSSSLRQTIEREGIEV